MNSLFYSVALLLCPLLTRAQLAVTVSAQKVVAQKAAIPLLMRNDFTEKVESARAVVFLMDEQGKMVGQATQWVIGGSPGKSGLAAGGTNSFHFVVATVKPFVTTNLTAKITFTRVVLASGKLADTTKDVHVTAAK